MSTLAIKPASACKYDLLSLGETMLRRYFRYAHRRGHGLINAALGGAVH